MESDFVQLYSWLGLRPDCTLDEFKRAYRRRVAELHPDRHPGAGNGFHAPMRLSELTSLYGTATRFHREHGRLPGAEPRGRRGTEPVRASASQAPSDRPLVTIQHGGLAPGDSPARRRTLFAALVVVLILVLMVVLESSLPSPDDRPGDLHENPHAQPSDLPAEQSSRSGS
jgi:hypothetical protein